MAKQTKKINDLSELEKGKSPGAFQKILLWVLIPLMFATALLLIITKFANVNVFDEMKELSEELPFIGERTEDSLDINDIVLEERVITLQAEIQEKESQLSQLQQQLDTSSDEIDTLVTEQKRLLEEIASLQRQNDDTTQKFKEIVLTFEQMSAKSAAPVIINMNEAEAIQILTNLKPDKLAAILEKMPPEEAAKYTTMMAK